MKRSASESSELNSKNENPERTTLFSARINTDQPGNKEFYEWYDKSLPVYGNGENVRDWLFVNDHVRAIDVIFHKGKFGETYNIGGFNEWKNIDLVKLIIKTVDRLLGREEGASNKLITYVTDRAGHDERYALDCTKLKDELGWEPALQFDEGIEKTVIWYLNNKEWLKNVISGDYRAYYDKIYKN